MTALMIPTAAQVAGQAAVAGLFHTAVKTADLPASLVFYKTVLGLREVTRPYFGFPGAWLACPVPRSTLRHLSVCDPSGVQFDLTLGSMPPNTSPALTYVPGANFSKPAAP